MFAESFLRVARNLRRSRPSPPYALQTAWIVFYSIIGGFNCVLSLGGLRYFRSTNRCSIFISAIIFMFLVSRLTVWSRRVSPTLTLLLAGAVLALGMFDQAPRPPAPGETEAIRKMVQSDVAFGGTLEAKLPSGSMIFEMPVMVFIDAVAAHDLTGYELLRPYFVTKTMRFSFGTVRGRTREDWQWEVEKMPAAQMVATLEQYGFSAILINRKGYGDNATNLLNQLAAAGRTVLCEDDAREQVCVALKPSPAPVLPHTDDRANVLYRNGWAVHQRTALNSAAWAKGDASLTFFSEPSGLSDYSFRCLIGSGTARRVTIEMGQRELWSSLIPASNSVPVDITVTGRRGNNEVHFKTDAPPEQTKEGALPHTFLVINLQITKLP
jgi:phosphoglycerol transferase